jgi:hypothetical protein
MSLSYRQENQLRRIEIGLRQSDRHLGAMFSIFGKLYPDQDKPPWEEVPQVSCSRDRLYRAAAWLAAALAAIAAAISALLAAAVSVARARWRIRGIGHQARMYPPKPESGARQGC